MTVANRQFFMILVVAACLLTSVEAEVLPGPLTPIAGSPDRGLGIIRDATKPSCLICHQIPSLPDPGQGQLGPSLAGVAGRYSAEELRQRIIDARAFQSDTIMPPYYSTKGLLRVGRRWLGQTIYQAQDVEDVVAFLMTLKD